MALVGLALLVTACVAAADGPSPTEPHEFTTLTVPTTTTTTVSSAQGLADYESCLRESGVEIGEIGYDGRDRPLLARAVDELDFGDPTVLEALDACAAELPTALLDLAPDPELRVLVMSSLSAFADCMREQGISGFPDPDPRFDGIGAPFPVNRVPWTDEHLSEAASLCSRDVLGGAGE